MSERTNKPVGPWTDDELLIRDLVLRIARLCGVEPCTFQPPPVTELRTDPARIRAEMELIQKWQAEDGI